MAARMESVYGRLGTLYQQCGGVFGVSGFVDKCMDKWMQDPTLNANAAVATWHESAQRPGFKFLVVQIVCQLSGGPQAYTGRPMDEAHKHLNITEAEWDKFMELFSNVCDEMNLPGDVVGDLFALMISQQDDCIVYPGQPVPPNPGPAVPRGNSLYARLGGVYPIALFTDRLVDAMIADDRVQIPTDDKRTEASLKYLFTELVCSISGGPEVRTGGNHDECKLLIPKAKWPILVNTANTAAGHLPRNLIPELVQTIQRNKDAIVDPQSPNEDAEGTDFRAAEVKDLRAAAAGENLTTAANARRALGGGASVAARRRVHGDPRTLYGRGGGVFGLSKLSDRLMDVWMENQLLNANQSVAKWHESRQKFGFKFLVTQLLGYLTGGPQRYTGQSMEASHKHLGITPDQWNAFTNDADRVFREFNIEQSVHRELMQVIQGFQAQCTVQPGERVPEDPGLCRKKPDTNNAYAHLGGIYPIAQFVNNLVDSVLTGPRALRIDHSANGTGTRTPAALKYLVTELVANSAGGPELVTAKDFEEAKLGVQVEQWDDFIALVNEAAVIWPTSRHRELVVNAITEKKADICIGLVDESGVTDARRQLAEAGFGIIEQAAALDSCNGDAARALELLRSGWTPESEMRRTHSGSSLASMDTDYDPPARLPGSGPLGVAAPHATSSGASGSACPFLAGVRGSQSAPATADQQLQTTIQVLSECGKGKTEIAALISVSEAEVDAALTQDRYAIAARYMAKKKVKLPEIGKALKMTEARVHSCVYSEGGGHEAMGGRLLGNALQKRFDDLTDEDSEMCCPVTLMLFTDPVIASDGFMYEADSVKQLIRNRQKSPITREDLKKEYFPAKAKKAEVMAFREERSATLLQFAKDALSSEPRLTGMALDRVVEYLEVLKPASAPTIAREAAAIWEKTGKPLPPMLRPHLGMS
eukprot:gnl/TRDRNA2_/TRDRNA2_129377_c0_seq1.p1 gnl/TRDRNA2_/TRDRNA2_129377_c0~~gnl/TRDRNA2_/TRDRNA2_129377_c0_seq1.p1  ORF type:complete len:932 (-),score=160.76 gnl/TRDRNA2_/TRDRNA2_129377_c0_seq1:71-2866(-)